jgi:hypothetical protein
MNFDSLFEKAFNDVFREGLGKYSEFITEENLEYLNSSNNKITFNDSKINLLSNTSKSQFHPLYPKMKTIHATFNNKKSLDNVKSSEIIKNFDDALSIYLFASWNFNSCKENLLNIKIALILREYLNFIGWDNLKIMADYQIVDYSEINYGDDFTKSTLGDYLPELLDDFIGVYLKCDGPDFDSSFSEVKEFISELCNILYNEDLISFMIEPLEE